MLFAKQFHLLLQRKREKLTALVQHLLNQLLLHPMIHYVEEPVIYTSLYTRAHTYILSSNILFLPKKSNKNDDFYVSTANSINEPDGGNGR